MDEKRKEQTAVSQASEQEQEQPREQAGTADSRAKEDPEPTKSKKSAKPKKACKKASHKAHKSVKKTASTQPPEEASDAETSDESSEASSESKADSSEEEEPVRQKKKAKKSSKHKKRRNAVSDSAESEDSESEEESESPGEEPPKKAKKTKGKKLKKHAESDDEDSNEGSDDSDEDLITNLLQAQIEALKAKLGAARKGGCSKKRRTIEPKSAKLVKKGSKTNSTSPNFKRVDQLWDSKTHNYQLKDSADVDEAEYAEYAFLVRRCFSWENKYTETVIDVKSKSLRAALTEVMKDCKSVSLEAEEPTLDPNILFLYLEELRAYYKKTLKVKIKAEKKRKAIKKLEQQRSLTKTLVSYIDEDYADIKKRLYPLLEAGNITFDLMWALFKPNEIALTSCYGAWDEARCFKVEYANKFCTMQRGEWYCIEGKYLEYDGKAFGYGDFEVDVDAFKGPRKITSLATYPLKYHKEPEAIRKQLVARGERFVNMEGMQYRFHKGLAFMKKKRQVARININGRIMVDPGTFRRINPNYPISLIKAKDADELFSAEEDEDEECSCNGADSEGEDEDTGKKLKNPDHSDNVPKYKYKWEQKDGRHYFVAVEVDEDGNPIRSQRVDGLEANLERRKRKYTEEELLLTSPVVLGFAFSEKLWLEFSLSGVRDIEWNEHAFDSLVLPDNQKDIVRALVESHKFNAAKTIDDVVQGKGKGLVSVLHGPPGTGKTLTAEGISELLRCPLYMVSAGELGTDPAKLEYELQTILDIAHSWGAVLLLDEADVFLEARQNHDIHRNALVSIFLRLLEYFQGILFLTTNRVDTFDEAFQSRIHLPLRYGELTNKAKKSVWKMFLDLVRQSDETSVAQFSEYDLDVLSRHQMNGRQIKNAVRTAQALALREKKMLDIGHVKKVLEVSETFERDLKGGTGYLDAMRSYT
ncbi:hypothetical protein BAUCODRAFT_122792 [Baudoinia panamericana UAMH 10762]|uniref:AAA+ ATPase domain-containing protein n=1 Tax=Baudoinia panamericana (strain UAMH 10762) TaxID=717646 RepID=M2MYY8_BAUPA|nr:uncharacterized protein BAUCODRAFT_122792 [Baudoinia panamericana UAMH 10762]EMC96833.1 hypothetical protein BAUCODRAFT_122792 [Baudoinia panamericana UAMH 10762]